MDKEQLVKAENKQYRLEVHRKKKAFWEFAAIVHFLWVEDAQPLLVNSVCSLEGLLNSFLMTSPDIFYVQLSRKLFYPSRWQACLSYSHFYHLLTAVMQYIRAWNCELLGNSARYSTVQRYTLFTSNLLSALVWYNGSDHNGKISLDKKQGWVQDSGMNFQRN